MKYDRILWDFNGTILDDVKTGIDSANELLSRYSLSPIRDVDHYHSVFGFPIRDYYERLGFDFSKLDYTVLAHEWVKIYLSEVKKAPLRDGILNALSALKERGIPQTILSMTEQSMLEAQLSDLGLTPYFDEICGQNDVYAKTKLDLARRWREEHPKEHVLFVGDTTHDAESAEVIGCDCLLLTGGHQSLSSLKESGVPIIASPLDVLPYFATR